MAIVEFKNVTRIYKSGDNVQKALDGANFSLDEGKFVVILGPSGAGKSTLLNMLGGLDSPTSGTIKVNGKDISTLSNNELADYRAATVGFVFQFYNLIPTLTVYENVALDSETGVLVLKLLLSMARNYGKAIVIVTHNQSIAKMADVVIRVKNGKIRSCEEQENPRNADEVEW